MLWPIRLRKNYEFFSLLPLGEGPGMRVCERNLFSYLCSGVGEWHSKTKISIGVDAAIRFPRPAFAFINRKDQLHVMPRSSEH